jgi:hypothetical protein
MQVVAVADPRPVPDPRLRLRVRVSRSRLDREIGAGVPLDGSPALALRANQLATMRARETIAVMLARILEAAEEFEAASGSPVIVEHVAVLGARAGILELIERLRSAEPLHPRGIALARLLAQDRRSPIICQSVDRSIGQALADIAQSL